ASVLLPPLSTVDRTATTASSIFSTWAQLQQQLNHPADPSQNGSGGGPGFTGFSTEVKLAGELKRSNSVVFSYTGAGTYLGPKYFRGVSVLDPINGEWKYDPVVALKELLLRGTTPDYGETYQNPTIATFTITMAAPPAGNTDILFYPGVMIKADRDTVANEI